MGPHARPAVGELAKVYAGLAMRRDEDWIWEAMVRHPDLVGGFNRLDSTVLKCCQGRVIAKEGADGLLGLAIDHPEFPRGLGVVIKIAHGWDPRATWYVARGILGTLDFDLRSTNRRPSWSRAWFPGTDSTRWPPFPPGTTGIRIRIAGTTANVARNSRYCDPVLVRRTFTL